jgi:hypothetical protein
METNFKLIKNGTQEITADRISWVTWNQDGGGGIDESHDDIQFGRSLILDFQYMTIDELEALIHSDYAMVRTKSAYKYLTKPVVDIINWEEDRIEFETEDASYVLHIALNPKWNGKSPFMTE